ncbi:MAG: LysE family transporter [Marinobacterium sp.]|nr:LysE family transporter [Marinobacterium sp.]
MEYLNSLLTLTGVMMLSVVSPGPNFAVVTSTSLGVSRKAGVMTGLGLALASISWSALAILGIGLILSHASWLYDAVRIAGGLYLIWIGIKMVRAARQPATDTEIDSQPPGSALHNSGVSSLRFIGKGFLVSMTSPKSLAFYASIFVTFVPQQAPLWVYLALVMIPTVTAGLWYCSVALMLTHGPIQAFFNRARAALDITLGLFLAGFGANLLISR